MTDMREIDFEAMQNQLQQLGSDIVHATARVQASAEAAQARIDAVTLDLANAILAEQIGAGTADRVAELRRDRQTLRDAIEDAELIDMAAERAEALRAQRIRSLFRARERGQAFELDLPHYLDCSE